MRMPTANRFLWLFALLCLACLAINAVHSLTDEKIDESEDFFDEGNEIFDYDALDDSENIKESEYGGPPHPPPHPPPPGDYGNQLPPPPPPPPQAHYYEQPPQVEAYPAPPVYQQPQPVYQPQQPVYQQQPQPSYQPGPYEAPEVSLAPVVVANYSQQVYQQPPAQLPSYQPAYPPPAANYSQQVYPEPQVQQQAYQPVYPQPAANYSQQVYQEPQVQQQQTYQPAYPQPAANYSQQAYQQPQVQQPAYPQPVANYSQQSYQQPQQTYQQPQQTYQQAPPTYQPVQPVQTVQPVYQQPPPQQVYQPVYPPVVANYSQPQPQKQSYAPQAKPQVYQQQAPVAVNYTSSAPQTSYVAPKPANYSTSVVSYGAQQQPQPVIYSPAALAQKYSLAELAPFTTPFGYRGNHWSLHYYRFNYLRAHCPKQMYGTAAPAYRDIEQAFAHAVAQLGPSRANVQYLPPGAPPSFAARHQIFSYLSQQNARLDEEGLLVEFVSQYLAERLCMSKWDRQRYLPSLTRIVSASQFPASHSCSQYHANPWQNRARNCYQSKYRTHDGFCNNPYHPYWGKSNVCHIRLLSPDYADGVSLPRESHNPRYPLPNPRLIANVVNSDIPLEGPYNHMKMQWGQFINHDISNTALSSYDGLVDCCRQPQARGCWPIVVPPNDRFYAGLNVTCLNFIRSGVCPTCQLGPRQQTNKNTAFLDCSHVYGNNLEQANQLRTFVRGQLKTSGGRNGDQLLPVASSQEQCTGSCFQAGDSRVNQHPALTAMHTLLVRNHNRHAQQLALRHANWNDELLYQEARRINIAEYQMITYGEYLPIVFGPILSAYYQLLPARYGSAHAAAYTQYNPKVDPTTWNEYTTAACRFGHSQISSTFGLYSRVLGYGQTDPKQATYRLREWFMRPSMLNDGMLAQIVNGLLARPSLSVDPWVTTDVRNHLYQSPAEKWGGDLIATNIWRGRDHGLPGYVHYLEYCFNYKVRGWKELQLFIPNFTLNQLRKLYRVVENIDLFTGGLAERHFPGADIGPTFACVNGIQYNHLKFGDRFYFEHGNQAGSFNPAQLDEIKRATLARLLCRTAHLPAAPQYAFLQPSMYNPLVNCSQLPDIDYNKF